MGHTLQGLEVVINDFATCSILAEKKGEWGHSPISILTGYYAFTFKEQEGFLGRDVRRR